ncbi:MAG: hypothetical protein JXB49_26960 [Bacteroidales bacterium]|nr:hypothetical protein [Bacteroidales bacterium]
MKNKNLLSLLLAGLAILAILPTGCKKDDDDDKEEEKIVPTITLLSPTLSSTREITPSVGDVVVFKIAVHADNGLSEVTLNDERIAAYFEETDDTLEYQTLIRTDDDIIMDFEVIDATSASASLDAITINPLAGEDLGLLLIDFGGKMTAKAPWEGNTSYADDWDKRTVYTFDIVSDVSDEAITQIANDEATITFKADNPEGEGKVFEMVKTAYYDTLGGQCQNPWGSGWVHQMIDLGANIPQATVEGVAANTKVIKMDVYYDATVTNTFIMDSIITLADRYGSQPWGADVTQGFLIVCILANTDKHMELQKSYDNDGYFISMKGYFTVQNQWTTVEFDMVDTDRSTKWDETNAARALSNEVDMVHFIVSGGYEGVTGNKPNLNPIYFKNLRIVDK